MRRHCDRQRRVATHSRTRNERPAPSPLAVTCSTARDCGPDPDFWQPFTGISNERPTSSKQFMTRAELELIRRSIRELDCGYHYCRYCSAGTSNRWVHHSACLFEASTREAKKALAVVDKYLRDVPPE